MRYTEAFLPEKPRDSLDTLFSRIKKAKAINEELADYFRERAAIEDLHAKQLLKLSKKTFVTDKAALGTLASVCDRLFGEILETAAAHTLLSQKIVEAVEKPLREFWSAQSDWNDLKQQETLLYKTPKEYEEKLGKIAKYKKATEKASGKKSEAAESKLSVANLALNDCRTAWEVEATPIFDRLQKVDESRLDHFKDIIVKYYTTSAELSQAQTDSSKRIAVDVSAFDIQGEIDHFCNNKGRHPAKSHSSEDITATASGFVRNIRPRLMSSLSRKSLDASMRDKEPTANSPPNTSVPNVDAIQAAPSALVDDEGYTIRASTKDPWGDTASTHRHGFSDDEDTDSMTTQQKIKLEIRKEAIQENLQDAASAFNKVSGTLQMGNSGRKVPNVRGRRDRSNTVTSTDPSESAGTVDNHADIRSVASSRPTTPIPTSPVFNAIPAASSGPEIVENIDVFGSASSPTTIRSAVLRPASSSQTSPTRSLSSPTRSMHNSPVREQVINSPLTNRASWKANVTETISVLMQGGEPVKMAVTGEISLQKMSGDPSIPFRLRIGGVDGLEKIVPNTTFLSLTEGNQMDWAEYHINATALAEAIQPGDAQGEERTIAILKYQVRVPQASRASFCPINATTVWRCQPQQASLLVSYGPNPACELLRDRNIEEVSVLVGLEGGGSVGGCVSKPVGVWSGEKRALFWNLDDLKIPNESTKGNATLEKLLARIETENQASSSSPTAFRFTIRGATLSGLTLEKSEGKDSGIGEVTRIICSGRYLVSP